MQLQKNPPRARQLFQGIDKAKHTHQLMMSAPQLLSAMNALLQNVSHVDWHLMNKGRKGEALQQPEVRNLASDDKMHYGSIPLILV